MKGCIIKLRRADKVFCIGLSAAMFLLAFGCAGPNRTTPVRVTLESDYPIDSPIVMTPPIRTAPPTTQPVSAPSGWAPGGGMENKKRWEGIIIHHSATRSGNAEEIDKWHKQQGWEGLGYHFVIDNGQGGPDGTVQVGYRWRHQMTGAHCREAAGDDNYWNEHTIGICLVGDFEQHQPTPAQYDSLERLTRFLQRRYNIPTNKIIGHGDVIATACPGRLFSWAELRRRL